MIFSSKTINSFLLLFFYFISTFFILHKVFKFSSTKTQTLINQMASKTTSNQKNPWVASIIIQLFRVGPAYNQKTCC